jgi:hypothetical protein
LFGVLLLDVFGLWAAMAMVDVEQLYWAKIEVRVIAMRSFSFSFFSFFFLPLVLVLQWQFQNELVPGLLLLF